MVTTPLTSSKNQGKQESSQGSYRLPFRLFETHPMTGSFARVELVRVIRGSFNGRQASYIGLVVTHARPAIISSCKLDIVLSFYRGGPVAGDQRVPIPQPGSGPKRHPVIVKYRPKRHYGIVHNVVCNSTTSFAATIGLPPISPITAEVTAGIARARTDISPVALKLSGYRPPEPRANNRNRLQVTVCQDEVWKEGILREVPVGLIVDHEGHDFVLSAKLTSRAKFLHRLIPVNLRPYRIQWRTIIDCRREHLQHGDRQLDRRMEKWDAKTWRQLVTFLDNHGEVDVGE